MSLATGCHSGRLRGPLDAVTPPGSGHLIGMPFHSKPAIVLADYEIRGYAKLSGVWAERLVLRDFQRNKRSQLAKGTGTCGARGN